MTPAFVGSNPTRAVRILLYAKIVGSKPLTLADEKKKAHNIEKCCDWGVQDYKAGKIL